MRRCFKAVLVSALALATVASELKQSPVVDCNERGVTLEVRSLRANVDNQVAFTTRAYFYEGKPMMPGPVITMAPGKRCKITVVNKLSAAGNAACMTDMVNGPNMFHCADVTNLHTHGLHVGPLQDDVSVSIWPGANHTYTYDIPADHLMGTHWYHAHHHGAVGLHTLGGMAGVLLVTPTEDYLRSLPKDLRVLYDNEHATKTYTMLLNHVFLGPSDPEHGDMSQYSLPDLAAMYNGNTINTNPKYFTGVENFIAVNGQYKPTVHVTSGQTALFRMVHASGTRALVLKLDQPQLCTLRLLARDGIFQSLPYLDLARLVLIQATRADVAVYCTLPVGSNKPIRVNVYASNATDDIGPLWGNVHAQDSVFSILIKARTRSKKLVGLPTSVAPLPAHISNLLDKPVHRTQVVDMDNFAINTVPFPGFSAPAAFRYVHSQCLGKVYRISSSAYTGLGSASGSSCGVADGACGGGPGTPPEPLVPGVFNPDAGLHAYHQHQNQFQVEHFFGLDVDPDFFRIGEFRDTMSQIVTFVMLRSQPLDYTGDVVMHCHVAQHEDMGMMALYNVQDCGDNDEPTLPV